MIQETGAGPHCVSSSYLYQTVKSSVIKVSGDGSSLWYIKVMAFNIVRHKHNITLKNLK